MVEQIINFKTFVVDWNKVEEITDFQHLSDGGFHSEWHMEGSTLNHVKLVVSESQKYLSEHSNDFTDFEKRVLITAALFHDIGKGPTNRLKEDGNYSAPYHSIEGEKITRYMLWDEDFYFRESVCSLVRYHMKPKHFKDKSFEDVEKNVIEMSFNCNLRLLYHINLFDVKGAISLHKKEEIMNCNILKEHAIRLNCWENPYDFETLQDKFDFFYKKDLPKEEHVDFGFCIVILCGVVGAGKTLTYENKYKPLGYEVISRDIIRQELGMVDVKGKFKGNKEQEEMVTKIEHQRIKELCEQKKSFVSDNIFLQKKYRDEFIKMVIPYNPYIIIEYHETSKQNHIERRKGQIDENIIIKMMKNMEFPSKSEGHNIVYYEN